MRIGFLVGDIVNISGGSNVIIEHAAGLRDRGHDVVLIPSAAPANPPAWHPLLERLTIRPLEACRAERFDFLFATWWVTWFDLHLLDATVYGYFNQSYESRFHAERHHKLQNRATYSLPLFFITEARWIEEFITHLQPQARVRHVPNGLSSSYFPVRNAPTPRTGPLKVIVEGPWGVPFKGVKESFNVLEAASREIALEVSWLTSNAGGQRPNVGGRPVSVHERIPIDQVASLLRKHDVMLKLSTVEGMYGPPLEMFSQGGTAITTPVSGCDEYIVHGHNALLAPSYDELAPVRYLTQLAQPTELLTSLKRNALATARAWPDWKQSTRGFADALEEAQRDGYSNAHLRSALAGVSAMRTHWADEAWREANRTVQPAPLGHWESLVLKQVRAFKSSASVRTLKRASPQLIKNLVKKAAARVLQ